MTQNVLIDYILPEAKRLYRGGTPWKTAISIASEEYHRKHGGTSKKRANKRNKPKGILKNKVHFGH